MTDTSRWAVEHPLGLIIRLTEDPDTGAWDDPTSSYARGVEAAALIRALLDERARAQAREAAAYEAAAIDVSEWGTLMCGSEYATFGIMSDIRALTPADAKAALDRLIAEAEAREREACARLVDDFAAAIRRGADVCRESHPSFAADRDEYADDAEHVAAAIRNRRKGDE